MTTEAPPTVWRDAQGNTYWPSRWLGFSDEQLEAAAAEYEAKPELDLLELAAELRSELAGRAAHGGRLTYYELRL